MKKKKKHIQSQYINNTKIYSLINWYYGLYKYKMYTINTNVILVLFPKQQQTWFSAQLLKKYEI